jgi:hypothetical protein
MNFGNEFWLILQQEYINSKLFAVSTDLSLSNFDGPCSDKLPVPDAGGLSSSPQYFFMRTSLEA